MKRRQALKSTIVAVAGLAGCSGPLANTQQQASSSQPLSEYGCPPYGSEIDGFVCSHTVDSDAAPVYLLPSEQSVTAPGETLDLTLYNDSESKLVLNPYQWTLTIERSDGWEIVPKQTVGDGRLTVGPGQSHTWPLPEIIEYIDADVTLDPGTYAAEIGVPTPEGSDWTMLLALFRLV